MSGSDSEGADSDRISDNARERKGAIRSGEMIGDPIFFFAFHEAEWGN